ncbi:MAG: hypothetical protein H0U59_14235 [Gemmatimonadaceae bacterium]|nr:hypothetical protein [Gemmatimonadaceae bacterium]
MKKKNVGIGPSTGAFSPAEAEFVRLATEYAEARRQVREAMKRMNAASQMLTALIESPDVDTLDGLGCSAEEVTALLSAGDK